jgi:ABC-2 type transport system ATP-binding protein
MKQRLGLAAALLKDPRLLILDEPTNGLDPAGMADIRVTIRKLAAAGCTILLSSHLLTEVEQICDRVGVISDGALITETTVADLRSGGTLRVVATPLERARTVLASVVGARNITVDGGGLDLDVAPEEAAGINSALVGAGVLVSELRWREPDLEATFLELTGAGHA